MHTSITWKKPGAHVVAWCFCQSDKKIEWGKKSQLVNGDIQIIFLKKNIQIIYHWTLFSKLYYWTIHVHVVWYSTPCAESWLQSLCSAGSLQCCTYRAPCRAPWTDWFSSFFPHFSHKKDLGKKFSSNKLIFLFPLYLLFPSPLSFSRGIPLSLFLSILS